jgi:hypothetical protein
MRAGRTGAAVLMGMAIVAGAGRAAKIDTSTLPGHWVGSWQNTDSGSSGTIDVFTSPFGDDGVRVDWNVTGTVFGCPQPGTHVGGVLLRGQKSAGFSDSKIFVKGEDDVWGKVTIKTKGTKFVAKGKKPCAAAGGVKSYKASATLAGTTLTGTLRAKLTSVFGGGTANVTFGTTKQPS